MVFALDALTKNSLLLYDLSAERPFDENVADGNTKVMQRLFALGVENAGGRFSDFIHEWATLGVAVPRCSELALGI